MDAKYKQKVNRFAFEQFVSTPIEYFRNRKTTHLEFHEQLNFFFLKYMRYTVVNVYETKHKVNANYKYKTEIFMNNKINILEKIILNHGIYKKYTVNKVMVFDYPSRQFNEYCTINLYL